MPTPNRPPRVAAIQDISGFGRASTAAILPVLAAMGIQACPLPTAVLSSHTGDFKGFTFRDLTDDMLPYARHWESEGITFEAVYTGFLGSSRQIDIVSTLIDELRGGGLVLVDPVMGDGGRLYKTYNADMQRGMRALAEKADIITPNLTETSFMLEKDYFSVPLEHDRIRQMLTDLGSMGPEKAVVTGIMTGDGRIGTAAYDRASGKIFEAYTPCVPIQYPGTGDLFASVLLGGLLGRHTLASSIRCAAGFVHHCAARTFADGSPVRDGVNFEPLLRELWDPALWGDCAK